MSYPNVTATGHVANPPERIDHPTKTITTVRVAFSDKIGDQLYVTLSAYGTVAEAASTLVVGEQIIATGYLRPIRSGVHRGHLEFVAVAIGVVPEPDDPPENPR